MLQSQLFSRTLRENPKDAVSANAQLLERGGFIYKNSAGVYSYLPLGWRVLNKIAQVVREEMNALGAQELLMPALVERKYWEITGRWNVDIGYEVRGKEDKQPDFFLGWTHEEVLTEIASKFISSYKDLPFSAYQIQTKFRNEPRAKSGILRGKEFIMKDLYSFHDSEEDLFKFYEECKKSYKKIFDRMSLKAIDTVAAGGAFTAAHTHEFQVLSDVGEDEIIYCEKCEYAENIEISNLLRSDLNRLCPKCGGEVSLEKAIEVGNVFPLGTKYSEAFNLKFISQKGEKQLVVMGSYGIGLGRAMGTIVEIHHDDKGIIWPEAVAPFRVHLIELGRASAKKVYQDLQNAKVEVLYDDRQASAGEKLTDADLLGVPWRWVISEKTGDKVEVKRRDSEKAELVNHDDAFKLLR